ncbi:MAG: flagellar biosynthetic protein FliR [Candidatus Eisenbacteria bacterium]
MEILTLAGAERFGLLLVRCLSFFIAGPIFAQQRIPAPVKILLGAATAIALFGTVPPEPVRASGLVSFVACVAGETALGLLLGLAAAFPFAGINLAGSLVGVQMGFGIVSAWDPHAEGEDDLITRLYGTLALLLFLLLNGHHLLLRALGLSLKALPLGGVVLQGPVVHQVIGLAGSLFVVSLAVGGPLLAVLFLADAAMGFVARTVPQMNIFIVGFPVKIGIGILGIALTIPFFTRTVDRLLAGLERDLLGLLAGM